MDKRRITTLGKYLANRAALEGMLRRGRAGRFGTGLPRDFAAIVWGSDMGF